MVDFIEKYGILVLFGLFILAMVWGHLGRRGRGHGVGCGMGCGAPEDHQAETMKGGKGVEAKRQDGGRHQHGCH
jgi:hypothetical protein